MSLVILVPLLVALLGMLVYALSANAKLVELGRLAFACGLIVTLLVVANHLVRLS